MQVKIYVYPRDLTEVSARQTHYVALRYSFSNVFQFVLKITVEAWQVPFQCTEMFVFELFLLSHCFEIVKSLYAVCLLVVDEEMRRTDELLYQMIPRTIADRLRAGEAAVNTCQVRRFGTENTKEADSKVQSPLLCCSIALLVLTKIKTSSGLKTIKFENEV